MDSYLPSGFQPETARSLGRGQAVRPDRHLHVEAGSIRYPVLRTWSTGFVVEAATVPTLSGVVDVYDGAEHLYQALIVSSQTRDEERVFEVKRANPRHMAGILEHDNTPAGNSAR